MEKWKISDALCTLCPNSPVYAVLLSDRWRQYELISSECLQATPSVGSSSSWDGPVYFICKCLVSVQTGLKGESDDKQNKARAGVNGCSRFASQWVIFHMNLEDYQSFLISGATMFQSFWCDFYYFLFLTSHYPVILWHNLSSGTKLFWMGGKYVLRLWNTFPRVSTHHGPDSDSS